ncbi:VapA/VapB family virulence-associated protein [Halomonas denitrificans]|uniref:VapA/VapB family virulence-associated protein n=1 Tax=Halomonas denitrificans TaxID=370769 RepID=UPI000D375C5A|nr:VapA/VapB family virulence-associated protein [Halomonas denitrificans]
MNMAQEVSREVIAHDFIAGMHGKLDQNKIAEASKALMATQAAHSANGSVASLIFYLQFQVNINGGKTFDGKAGGISTPGGGALFGNVYTDDLDRLYRDTTSFEYQGTPVYLSVLFFDKHSTLLGHFQSGAVSTVIGVGGGSGHWS